MWVLQILLFVLCVLVAIITALATSYVVIKKQRKERTADMELQPHVLGISTKKKQLSFQSSAIESHGADLSPRSIHFETFSIDDLRRATGEFSPTSHIEGSVFHGRLNGKDLAVKRLSQEAMSRIEFNVIHQSAHHHPNILKLLGTCDESDPILVFEYAANGSLKDWLHGGLAVKNQFIASCYRFLTWEHRLKVCLDVAESLQYMHETMTPSYTHGNVKSRNIFLDEKFNAKIGNFGMGKRLRNESEDREFCSTNPASWSHGYLAPEFIRQPILSPCVDIFAYGVVLLEVLSGETPIAMATRKGGGYVSLSEKIKTVLLSEKEEAFREWMDTSLGDSFSIEAAMALAKLARACVADDPSSRPSAGEIALLLSSFVEEHELDLPESVFSEKSWNTFY